MVKMLIAAGAISLATMLGACIGLLIHKVSHKWNDIMMGLAAGVMLASAILGLILPATETVGGAGFWKIVLGILAGAYMLTVIDKFTPHLHRLTGVEIEKHEHNAKLDKIILFLLAIAIHNFPEGIATGVGFGGNPENLDKAWLVTFSIALQNIPEGLILIAPLRMVGVSKGRTFLLATSTAVIEVIGTFTGYLAGNISQAMLPVLLALAGGAMLYVISDEMIPETHGHGHEKLATYSLLIGFIIVLFFDVM